MNTPEQTALRIAQIFYRSQQHRARVSEATVRLLGRRRRLRSAFVILVTEILSMDFDLTMVELASGGFGIISTKALEGAKIITAKKLLSEEERRDLKRDDVDYDAIRDEIEAHKPDETDDSTEGE